MKRILTLTAAALMGASMLAAPAVAQTSGGGTGGTTESGVTGGAPAPVPGSGTAASGTETDTNAGASPGTSSTTGAMEEETDSSVTGAIETDATFDGAIAAIEANATSTAALETMTEVGSVEIIKIGELEGADMAALETAKTENGDAITELQTALEANTIVTAALEAEDVQADQVVATEMGADGGLVVYVE